MLSSDFNKLNNEERANLRAFWASQVAYLDQITQDNGVPILEEYCYSDNHQGGWGCIDCWNGMSDQERAKYESQKNVSFNN